MFVNTVHVTEFQSIAESVMFIFHFLKKDFWSGRSIRFDMLSVS